MTDSAPTRPRRSRKDRKLSPVVRFAAWCFIGVCFLVTAVIVAVTAVPGLVLLPVAHRLDRSPFCTLTESIRDVSIKLHRTEIAERIQKQSQLVAQEGELRLWRTPGGDWWVPGDSKTILPTLLAQQETKIYGDAGTGGVRPGDIVLDCGAHIGVYTKEALRGGARLVVAIEPSSSALRAFRKNVAAEIADGRVMLVEKGVWDVDDTLTFYENGNGAAGDSFLAAGYGAKVVTEVPVTTIDRIAADLNLERVDLIKADVKGAGARMVRGSGEVIRKWKPRIIISTEEPPEEPAEVTAAVLSADSSYDRRCGPCLVSGLSVRTDVLFFQ